MTDPIADMLTRIRNASAIRKLEVLMPFSKVKFSIAKVLEKEHYIKKVSKIKDNNFDILKIDLRYNNKEPSIKHLKRISTPGQRVYINSKEIPVVLDGYGLAIISTSKGILSGKEARSQKMGGEYICEIW